MTKQQKVRALQKARKMRVRFKMEGTAEKPRVSVVRSNRFVYIQAIDDVAGKTLFGISDKEEAGTKTEAAAAAAKKFAENLQKQSITSAIFDRGSYKYHGRVKAIAEALRVVGINV
ncbi:50S ribosomal protein L18 [Candidatus Woesebacteria bacterium]|nr:50S ribosomal protein L18 [Candidatus Woesebacteria bacterium]